MTEELIKFETAKLAKEKGYLEDCLKPYDSEGNLLKRDYDNCMYVIEENYPIYSAPTQSLLQKWLRETHDIDIIVFPMLILGENTEEIKVYSYNINHRDGKLFDFKSYEESLEEALYQALLLVKQNLSTK